MDISGVNIILFLLLFGLGVLLILKQISFQTLVKWLIGIGIFSLIILPIGQAAQQQYGNIVYFGIIMIFLIAFFAKFKFSRRVMEKTTGGLIVFYLKYFLIITGITAIVYGLINILGKWLKQ